MNRVRTASRGIANGLRLAAWLCVLLLAMPGQGRASPEGDLCVAAAHRAAAETGVPLAVLMAVSLTESGRGPAADPKPWPWTLNVAGKGYFLSDRAEALALAEKTRAGGQMSFDIGCFQLNYRWHGEHFASLEEMMEPRANALYAARFLSQLFEETGDWTRAAGFYHSRTPQHAARYRQIFTRHYAGLDARGLPDMPDLPAGAIARVQTPRVNNFPLLQVSEAPRSAGSLVPLSAGSGTGLFAASARPLWNG